MKDLIEQLEFFDLDFIKPDYLGMVISSNGADEKSFKKFVSFIEGLKEKYTPITKIDATYGIGDIDWCISELISQKEKAILERIENINEAKAKILMEYKRCLYAETEDIVKKYASVQASTCQQTMETGVNTSHLIWLLLMSGVQTLLIFYPTLFGTKNCIGMTKGSYHICWIQILKELERTLVRKP